MKMAAPCAYRYIRGSGLGITWFFGKINQNFPKLKKNYFLRRNAASPSPPTTGIANNAKSPDWVGVVGGAVVGAVVGREVEGDADGDVAVTCGGAVVPGVVPGIVPVTAAVVVGEGVAAAVASVIRSVSTSFGLRFT